MPFSARGAHYYGNAHSFLNCKVSHESLADKVYEKLQKEKQNYGTINCESCGAFITVAVRGTEWETRIFSRGVSKER